MSDRKVDLSPMALKARHRKQVQVQIWLPLSASILVVLALAAFAIYGTVNQSSEVNRWGSISAVLLIIPHLVTSLVTIVVLILIIRGISALYRKMPGWLNRLHRLLVIAQHYVRTTANQFVSPIIKINSAGKGLTSIGKKSTPR